MSRITNNKVSYGKSQGLIDVFNPPIVGNRAPGANDKGPIGQLWIYSATNTVYILTNYNAAGAAVWTEVDNGAGAVQMVWTREVGAAVAMANNHGYINTNAGLTTFTLPVVSPVGSTIMIIGEGAGGWIIAQNAGQRIRAAAASSTIGVGGTVSCILGPPNVHPYCCATLVCRVANLTFDVVSNNDGLRLA